MLTMVLGSALLALSCSAGRYADGVYRGSSDGDAGPIAVAVEVRGGRIVGILSEGQGGGHGLFDGAFAGIEKAVVARQAWDVDAIAGATVSSEGIKAAIKAALETAGRQETKGRPGP